MDVGGVGCGGGGFLAHLLRLAAAGSAPPRPQKSKSPHPAKPAERARGVRRSHSKFQELSRGHPTWPKRYPTPAQSDREAPGSVHLHCVGAASLQLRELCGGVLSHSCTELQLSRSQGPTLTGLVGWGATGTAHLARSSDFAIAGPVQGVRRTSLVFSQGA